MLGPLYLRAREEGRGQMLRGGMPFAPRALRIKKHHCPGANDTAQRRKGRRNGRKSPGPTEAEGRWTAETPRSVPAGKGDADGGAAVTLPGMLRDARAFGRRGD